MKDTITVALIASIGPSLVALINLLGQRRIGSHVAAIKKATDGMHDALVASTALASHAEGVKDEKVRVADVAKEKLDSSKEPCGRVDCAKKLTCENDKTCPEWEPVPKNPAPVVAILPTGQPPTPKVG
jgi:hypothetical protein